MILYNNITSTIDFQRAIRYIKFSFDNSIAASISFDKHNTIILDIILFVSNKMFDS